MSKSRRRKKIKKREEKKNQNRKVEMKFTQRNVKLSPKEVIKLYAFEQQNTNVQTQKITSPLERNDIQTIHHSTIDIVKNHPVKKELLSLFEEITNQTDTRISRLVFIF